MSETTPGETPVERQKAVERVVAVFQHDRGPGRAPQFAAYTRDYNPAWEGCCIHRVEAASGLQAKAKAIAEHKARTNCRGSVFPVLTHRPEAPMTHETPVERRLRMSAYYYTFEPTGNHAIDRILSAVACAGKAYHSTSEWMEDRDWQGNQNAPHPEFGGSSPLEWIQRAANDAAALLARCEETPR